MHRPHEKRINTIRVTTPQRNSLFVKINIVPCTCETNTGRGRSGGVGGPESDRITMRAARELKFGGRNRMRTEPRYREKEGEGQREVIKAAAK